MILAHRVVDGCGKDIQMVEVSKVALDPTKVHPPFKLAVAAGRLVSAILAELSRIYYRNIAVRMPGNVVWENGTGGVCDVVERGGLSANLPHPSD